MIISEFFIVASAVSMLFAANESSGMYFQVLGVVFVAFAWFFLLLRGYKSCFHKSNWLFWFLAIPVSVQSCLVSVYNDNFSLAGYSLFFTVAIFSIKAISNICGVYRLIDLFVYSSVLMLCAVISADWIGFVTALSVVQQETGLFRFSPFDNHPNLTAHVFGLAMVLALYRIGDQRSYVEKLVFVLVVICSFLVILAASSRGALLAVVLSIFFVEVLKLLVYGFNSGSRYVKFKIYFVFFVIVFLLFNVDYFVQILDIDSEYRGVGSGGSGRFGNWFEFIDYFFSRPDLVLFGHGFRSWSIAELGYDSDNSYLTLLYEIGLLFSLVVFFGIFLQIRNSLRYVFTHRNGFVVFAAIVFVVIESVFARYMIAIGNPAALMILALFFIDFKNNFTGNR